MKRKHKRKPIARRRFIINWVLVWYLYLFLPLLLEVPAVHFNFIDYPPLVITSGIALGVLAIFQIIVVRRCLHTELRHWLSLALLGFVVGQIGLHFFEMNVDRPPFPPVMTERLKEPESAAWFRYALYSSVWGFLRWYTPLAFQWLALWKRFRHHGLWLLAAVMAAPLNFIVIEHGGILGHAVDLLEHLTGFSLMNLPVVLLDWATPAIMMGLVLQYLVVKNNAFQQQVCQSA